MLQLPPREPSRHSQMLVRPKRPRRRVAPVRSASTYSQMQHSTPSRIRRQHPKGRHSWDSCRPLPQILGHIRTDRFCLGLLKAPFAALVRVTGVELIGQASDLGSLSWMRVWAYFQLPTPFFRRLPVISIWGFVIGAYQKGGCCSQWQGSGLAA